MKVVKNLLLVITWLLLIYTSFELGMWQLHRAQDVSEQGAPTPDQPLIALDKVSSAGKNMPIKAVNRIVSASGDYTNTYIALDQKIEPEVIVDLDVRLLKLSTGHAILVVITWLLLIYTSFELGMWQLHRAQDMNEQSAPTPDQPLISLDKVSSAGKNMPIKAVNRIVSASGNYTNSYVALDQKIEPEVIVDLDVRLLKLSTGHGILVVREIAKNSPEVINSSVAITGRLYPRQNVDRALPSLANYLE